MDFDLREHSMHSHEPRSRERKSRTQDDFDSYDSYDSYNLFESKFISRLESRMESKLESRLNMYERQIDQLFDFTYKEQDDIKSLFQLNESNEIIKKRIDIETKLKDLNQCIQYFYYLEIENKKRIESGECYQLMLFIIQIMVICYLLYVNYDT
jgi:hypothetical protein